MGRGQQFAGISLKKIGQGVAIKFRLKSFEYLDSLDQRQPMVQFADSTIESHSHMNLELERAWARAREPGPGL